MKLLIVDGYNIIGAWPYLNQQDSLAAARDSLIEQLSEYQRYQGIQIVVVFDAYEAKIRETKPVNPFIEILYSNKNETADDRIEKLVVERRNHYQEIHVATNDAIQRQVVFGAGALRLSAQQLIDELLQMKKDIQTTLKIGEEKKPRQGIEFDDKVKEKIEQWRRGEK
jgi:predicted RNA-binding protein with PIN domain